MDTRIHLQHPPPGPFSANNLQWTDKKCEKSIYGYIRVAYFHWDCLTDFLKGEESLNDAETNFRQQSVRKHEKGSLKQPTLDSYLEETLFWCASCVLMVLKTCVESKLWFLVMKRHQRQGKEVVQVM